MFYYILHMRCNYNCNIFDCPSYHSLEPIFLNKLVPGENLLVYPLLINEAESNHAPRQGIPIQGEG